MREENAIDDLTDLIDEIHHAIELIEDAMIDDADDQLRSMCGTIEGILERLMADKD